MMNEHVSTIMTKNVISISPDDNLETVKTLFDNLRVHHLPVVNGEKLVGLVTTYDLWKQDQSFDKYKNIKVRNVMNKRIAKLQSKDKIGTAAELLLDNRFHALPVVEKGNLVGIVTSFDILKYQFKKEYPRPILYQNLYATENPSILSR